MLRSYQVTPAKWNTTAPWCVDGRHWGKKRIYFKKKGEAESYAHEMNCELQRMGASAISPELRAEALAAESILRPLGATLTEVAQHYARYKSVAARSLSVNETVEQMQAELSAKLIRGDASEDHYRNVRKVGRSLSEAFRDTLCCDVRQHEVADWLSSLDLSDSSKDFYRRYACSIFAYAKLHGYTDENPAHGIPKIGKRSDICILTSDQVDSLMRNCAPKMAGFYGFGIFCGLRPMSELMRAIWADIDERDQTIEVKNVKTAGHSNSARERHVKMSDNLCEWVDEWVESGLVYRTGDIIEDAIRIVPGNWRDFVYGGARGNRVSPIVSDRQRAGIESWGPDIMRHTFASYHYAMHEDAGRTAAQMGHASPDLIFKHYRKKVTKEEARRFWSIRP